MENITGKVLGAFKPEELIFVNFYTSSDSSKFDPSDLSVLQDSWGNILVTESANEGDCYAADFEGDTYGNCNAINVLLLRKDLPKWEEQAKKQGVDFSVSDLKVTSGRYGCQDGSATCVLVEYDELLYWIEL